MTRLHVPPVLLLLIAMILLSACGGADVPPTQQAPVAVVATSDATPTTPYRNIPQIAVVVATPEGGEPTPEEAPAASLFEATAADPGAIAAAWAEALASGAESYTVAISADALSAGLTASGVDLPEGDLVTSFTDEAVTLTFGESAVSFTAAIADGVLSLTAGESAFDDETTSGLASALVAALTAGSEGAVLSGVTFADGLLALSVGAAS